MSVRLITAVALTAGAVMLTGCEQEVSSTDMDAYVEDKAKSDTMAEVAKGDTELAAKLAELKKADPSVKDAYYGVDENGNKQLHIVTQKEGEEKSQDSVWPLVAGLAGGALIGAIMANGGVSNYARTQPPVSSGYYSRDDERKRRNTYSSGYVGSVMANNRASIYRATPPGSPALKQATLSSKSTGIWSGGSSARASSHSSSGFGG